MAYANYRVPRKLFECLSSSQISCAKIPIFVRNNGKLHETREQNFMTLNGMGRTTTMYFPTGLLAEISAVRHCVPRSE